MASDEVGVELGIDTVEKCKLALEEAEELQVRYRTQEYTSTSTTPLHINHASDAVSF